MLSVRDLSFSYGHLEVLREISVDLRRSEVGIIIGPNAAGKTTLLKCIAGILTPQRGKIEINGRVVFERSGPRDGKAKNEPPHRRGIGYVPSDLGLFPHMTLRENIAFPLKKRGWSRSDIERRVRELGEMLSISEYIDLHPGKASRGTQQKAALARALAPHPELLLLDEPLASIDPFTRPFIRSELKMVLSRSETTTLITTHDIEDIRYFRQHVFVLLKGRVAYDGPFSEEAMMIDPMLASLAGHLVLPVEMLGRSGSSLTVRLPSGREIEVATGDAFREGERGYLIISSDALRISEERNAKAMRAKIYDVVSWNDRVELLGEVEGARARVILPNRKPMRLERGVEVGLEIVSEESEKKVRLLRREL